MKLPDNWDNELKTLDAKLGKEVSVIFTLANAFEAEIKKVKKEYEEKLTELNNKENTR